MASPRQPLDAAAAGSSNGSAVVSPPSSIDSRASGIRNQSARRSHISTNHSHRQSFSETLRTPGSPRSRRQPSITNAGVLSLIDNPPVPNNPDTSFAGRDWRHISIGELVSPEDLKFVEVDTGIEEATDALIDSNIAVLLIRETTEHKSAVGTFDFSDLNAYLLLAAGLTEPDEELLGLYGELARKAQEGSKITLRDVKDLGKKEPMTTLPATANVMSAVETFGGGVHRVVVVDENNNNEVVGIFSQFRLVKFLWENGRTFPTVDQLYPSSLGDLGIGSRAVLSINADRPLSEALRLMYEEGISSVAVVDNHFNVVGNISATDVKLLTRSSSLPLLHNTCTHFVSVVLSTRGLIDGQDSFPVFHVDPSSTLAHTVAKVVATKSHRLWVTDPLSPASSGPSTPSHSTTHLVPNTAPNPAVSPPTSPKPNQLTNPSSNPHLPIPHLSPQPGSATLTTSIPASALPGARLSGRLLGVVSLTDILNLQARASGLSPANPMESRAHRRRSSSSSMSARRSGELGRELFSRGF